MPEIKNTFSQGRMEKDIDERLVQPGLYRDLLNGNIGRSEGSDIGAIENLLGNEQISNIGAVSCIGSIKWDPTDSLYWFVKAQGKNIIAEYNGTTVAPVLVDTTNQLEWTNVEFITGINIIDGLLFFTDGVSEPKKVNIERSKVGSTDFDTHTQLYGRNFIQSDITVIKPHPTNILQFTQEVDPDSETLPWEDVFPNFSYRWRFNDGEYSPYAPFTETVFEPGTYTTREHYEEGYNTSIRNVISSITLLNIPRGPEDVDAVDVLYTESISSTVYTLLTVEREDFGDNENFITPQTINRRSFYAALPANQLNRQFDNVPRYAKAQEITANRLIYGNYTQNYNQPSQIDITVSQGVNRTTSGRSIKGNRNYQIGVAFLDSYGRQGAMITSPNSSIRTEFTTQYPQTLFAQINTTAPDWASSYRYFVKDTSAEHFNLLTYNSYNDGSSSEDDSEFVWVQFNSDDRNKITEDTFLIPRRETHTLASDSDFTNLQGFTASYQSVMLNNANASGTAGRSTHDRNVYVFGNTLDDHGVGITPGTLTLDQGSRTNYANGIYTIPSDGDYEFRYSGSFIVTGEDLRGNDFLELDVVLQISVDDGSTWNEINSESRQEITHVESTGNANRDFSWDVGTLSTFSTGDQVRALLISDERRGGASRYVRLTLNNIVFQTLSTDDGGLSPDPDEVAELGVLYPSLNRYKVLDIENEAPSVVINQIEDRTLGDISSLVDDQYNFGTDQTDPTADTNNVSAGTAVVVLAEQDVDDFDALRIAISQFLTTNGLDPLTDETSVAQTMDLTEIDDQLLVRFGNQENRVIVTELSWFYVTGSTIHTLQLTLGSRFNSRGLEVEGTGVPEVVMGNPRIDFIRSRISSNATEDRLAGSFFVKIARSQGLSSIPVGQSTYNDEGNISVLRSIWFETEPAIDESSLDLYWETSRTFDISSLGQSNRLPWGNCIAIASAEGVFIEALKIFDQFNSQQIAKGVRVNTPQERYAEENRFAGLIWSGIFNSRTGTNRLNQFIQSDGIIKDIEPNYGSIQRLHTRDTNLVVFAEDKVFRILADKDLLFNADGGGNVSASNAVLGQTTPFTGEYGIGLHPESFATYGNRMYFADRNRGVVIRLSLDGIEEISRYGMSSFFRDRFIDVPGLLIGSYDDYHNQYNLTFTNTDTVSFEEDVRGWTSRKSFVPESGLTLNNIYYTFKAGELWQHNSRNVPRNNFYGVQSETCVVTIMNLEPSSIKNFKTLNYEGTTGWTTPLIITDQEAGRITSYEPKEGKYFQYITPVANSEIVSIINTIDCEDAYPSDAIQQDDFGGEIYVFNDGDTSQDPDEGGGGVGIIEDVFDPEEGTTGTATDPDTDEDVDTMDGVRSTTITINLD